MKKLKLQQFLQDDKGNFSSTRLAFLLWVIALLVVWIIGSLSNVDGTLMEIPNTVIIIIATFMTGKVVQKHAENAASNPIGEIGQATNQEGTQKSSLPSTHAQVGTQPATN